MEERYLDKVVDTEQVREVVAVVHETAALEAIEESLMEHGFDRADIDLIANSAAIDGTPVGQAGLHAVRRSADHDRHEVVVADDRVGADVLSFGTTIAIGAMIGALVPLASDASSLVVATGVLVGALVGGAIGVAVRNRIVGWKASRALVRELRQGGMAVLVRVRSRAEEARALRIMRECRADNIHAHDVRIEKTLHTVPLAGLNPDPWLGRARLGG